MIVLHSDYCVLGTNAYTPPEYIRTGRYDGHQGTAWQMGILLVEILSPVMAFDKPEQALKMGPRIPEQLSSGNKLGCRSSVDRAPARCLRGHGFDSHPGLRCFLCPTLVTR